MDITNHPIWNQITPYKTIVSGYKKPLHLLKIYAARQYAKLFPNEMFIGISGSVGKTTCVRECVAVLSQKYKTISTEANIDPILNIPATIFRLSPSYKKAVLEMGIEYKGEMDFYLSLVKPKIAIITKIAYAHNQYLGDMEEIIEEKGKLIGSLDKEGIAILNWDDPNCKKLAEKCNGTVVYYGSDPKNCTLWAGNIKIENFKTNFELNFGVERVKVNLQLLGHHQIYPALAAATLGIISGIPLTKTKLALETIYPSEHCMQLLTGPNGSIILDDTCNSSPAALDSAIDTLLELPARRRIVVLGEMRELGKFSEKLHRKIAQRIYREKLDLVLLGQGDTNFIGMELKDLGFLEDKIESSLQNSQIVNKLFRILGKGDICLIKGPRVARLDEVVKRIAKKQTTQL